MPIPSAPMAIAETLMYNDTVVR